MRGRRRREGKQWKGGEESYLRKGVREGRRGDEGGGGRQVGKWEAVKRRDRM